MDWGAKFFHCQNLEEAQAMGCAHFGCEAQDIKAAMVQEPALLDPGLALVLYGKDAEAMKRAESMDGQVAVDYREDGVWLERYPSRGKGQALNRADAELYIKRKQIQGLEGTPLLKVLDAGIGMARIGPPQAERVLDQDLEVRISKDEMEAMVFLLPADPGGSPLTEEGAMQRLQAAGVVFGHNAMAVKYMISEQRFEKSYILAKGKKAVNGENGKIKFHFRTTLTAAPKVIDERTDKVDFRALDLFEPVQKDQLLVERVAATPGEPGMTVTGKELPPKPGKEAVLPRGKGTRYDEARMNMFAETAGMVQFSKGQVTVSHVYTVRGNCDMGVGNIDFDGNVEIQGGVISGMVVKATGNVVVGGAVEGATIEAGGDIVLKLGIQGMDRGRLIAGGDITAQFVERSEVTAGGNVTADTILHSTLAVAGVLTLRGKRGSLVGGTAKVAREVVAQLLGSLASTDTLVEVGVLPTTRERIEWLESECLRIESEGEKLDKLATYLNKGGELDAQRTKLYNSIGESKFQNTQLLAEYADEKDRLIEEVEHAVEGKVHVLGAAHPGVRLSIASGRMRLESEIPYATFFYNQGEISYRPCEVSRS